MKQLKLLFTILFFTAGLMTVSAAGQNEIAAQSADYRDFSDAVSKYNEGNLAEAAEGFDKAALSKDPDIAAASYYNRGTVQAQLADQAQNADEKRALLEDSFNALKRAAELDNLPDVQQKQARRNMEIVREKLSQLPETPPEDEQNNQDQQDGQDSSEGPQSGQNNEAQSGQNSQAGQDGQTSGADMSPDEMLQRQRDLSSRTENGEEDSGELAEEQKQLQKASEEAGLNEAAVNQAKAAKALSQGDREKAGEYQNAAEQALAEAADQGEDGEAEDILNQEAENNAQRNRLDKMGGIIDAERNW